MAKQHYKQFKLDTIQYYQDHKKLPSVVRFLTLQSRASFGPNESPPCAGS